MTRNYLLLISLCGIFFTATLFIGDIKITPSELFANDLSRFIFLHLRLPHSINVLVIGALLALVGYLMQAMLANPLADPYTLGASSGAAFFTLLGTLCGMSGVHLLGCSFAGSIFSLVILLLAIGNLKRVVSSQIILAGMILAAGFGALLSVLLIIAPASTSKSVLYWLFGNVDSQQYPLFAIGSLLVGLVSCLFLKKELMVLGQGELLARTLGVNVEQTRLKLLLISSLLTGAAVSIGGTIGFIGLIVPNLTRTIFKANPSFFLSGTMLMGGCLLLIADICSRVVIAPEQLPIGLFTTLLGLPFLLFLSRK